MCFQSGMPNLGIKPLEFGVSPSRRDHCRSDTFTIIDHVIIYMFNFNLYYEEYIYFNSSSSYFADFFCMFAYVEMNEIDWLKLNYFYRQGIQNPSLIQIPQHDGNGARRGADN